MNPLTILLLVSFLGGVEDDSGQIEVSHRARSLQPGEVVLVTVRSQLPLTRMEGRAFEKTFLFYPTDQDTLWQGLIGIDLATTAGRYPVELKGKTSDGSSVQQSYELQVEHKEFPTGPNGQPETYILERGIFADLSIVKAWKADETGNLIYRMTARNFNPPMAEAGRVTVAEVEEIVPAGEIDPHMVHTPGIYVDRIVVGENQEKVIERRKTR